MFVHLNLHSEYSVQDSILRINEMVKHANKDGQAALGIADLNNMFGAVKFYKACLQAGIKPIIGMTVEVSGEGIVCLLAMNNEGYANLLKMSSCIWAKPQGSCTRDQIAAHSNGLLAIISEEYTTLASENSEKIEDALEWWSNHFPSRLYFSVRRTGQRKDDLFIERCIYWGVDYNVPIIAINEVRFVEKEDFFAHEVRVCISKSRVLADKTRDFGYCEEQWFKSQAEMTRLFSDIPQIIQNTVNLASRCNVTIELGEAYLPNYPIPAGETIDEFFSRISHEGLQRRLTKIFPPASRDNDYKEIEAEYIDRLNDEMRIISEMGFIGYFLIVMDFIGWAKNNDIPVGIGRGSGAGSLVAYCLLITDLDPIGYKLLFERFLNPERVSMPDFDIDFCIEGRDRVIDYVKETYGREAVSQIIT
ncbi:MAG: DNA polymerase III subunit alpha, partial [Psychrobacter sp.]|nr:DNA polymerase III subunit alpha [Psychrobacter sp.]